jgi:hypothetical protein
VAHTFLVEAGRWLLQGNWLERNGVVTPIQGKTLVGWGRDNWFTIVTKMGFPAVEREEMTFQYRGRLSTGAQQYTFVLQHSELGRIEGEGWIAPDSIVQRYWVLGDQQRRSGFEAMHRVDNKTYHLSSSVMAGHHLVSTMEAKLTRQPNE